MNTIKICALFLVAVSLSAQLKPRLTILPFTGGSPDDAETIAEFFSFEDEINRVFTPVPRTRAIENLMKEQQFQRSGLTDSDTIAELGKQLNADYVLAGHIAVLGNSKLLLITIIDVKELRQIAGDYREYQRIESVIDVMPDMAKRIAAAVRDSSGLPRLAVLPFNVLSSGMDQGDAELLAQLLATELANSGAYAVFPRTKTIERVMEEHRIERSGMTDPESIKTIGEAVNAQYVLSANVRKLGSDNYFSASILHIVEASQGQGAREKYRTVNDGLTLMPRMAQTLIGKMLEENRIARERTQREAEAREAEERRAAQERARREAEEREAEERRLREHTVSSDTDFAQAIAKISASPAGGQYRITLAADITTDAVSFPAARIGKTIVIRGDTAPRSIIANAGRAGSDLFAVASGNTLVLENNVILDGNNISFYSAVRINDGGALVMRAGSRIEGMKHGSGVMVTGGNFTMEGGFISGNRNFIEEGGGVNVDGGTFTMSGGEISGNTAKYGGGVSIRNGRFTMSGGTISGNESDSGGGVFIWSNGRFTMSGGTISGNESNSGGGVYIWSEGRFTMSGGTISRNSAKREGGGVYILEGTFIKRGGGTIANNTAAKGKEVEFYPWVSSTTYKPRNSTAGPGVNIDTNVNGSAGGWE
jgi:TolB-like protein